jgi:GNAT superfamily N-acetyltransferase
MSSQAGAAHRGDAGRSLTEAQLLTKRERAVKFLDLDHLRQYSDLLRLRSGEMVTVRFVEPRDAEALQNYFRSLSVGSRYNRLMGAASELPRTQLEKFVHVGDGDSFSVVATLKVDAADTIVGEARYAFDPDFSGFELALSVDDGWQGHGIGTALLANLECRAAAFGAERLFGDTLRSNAAMLHLARKSGYAFVPVPGDWKQVRFEKRLDVAPQDIPCANWRLAAMQGQAAAAIAP